jgi:hypothetical protein
MVRRDFCLAVAALAEERRVGEDGEEVEYPELMVAVRTLTPRRDEILLFADAGDDGGGEAPEDGSEYADGYVKEFVHGIDWRKYKWAVS